MRYLRSVQSLQNGRICCSRLIIPLFYFFNSSTDYYCHYCYYYFIIVISLYYVIVRARLLDGNVCDQRDRCLRDRAAAVVRGVERAAVVVVVSIRLRHRRRRLPNLWPPPRNPSRARPDPHGPR